MSSKLHSEFTDIGGRHVGGVVEGRGRLSVVDVVSAGVGDVDQRGGKISGIVA